MEPKLTPPPSFSNLNMLISRLVKCSLPTAVRRKSFIVNDVPHELYIAGNENILAAVLSNLLNSIVSHTENSCIRVSAQANGNTMLVSMKDSGSFNKYTVACQVQQLQLLANKLGGFISIIGQRPETSSVTFSFPYTAQAA